MLKLKFFLLFILCAASCSDSSVKSQRQESNEEGLEVRVVRQMGQMPADTINYLPLIGSMAESKSSEDSLMHLILGKNIENGANLRVQELSTLVFNHGADTHKIIISVPIDEQFRSIDVNSFEELATQYGSIKWALESWYNHFGGLGNSRFVRWEKVTHN